MVPANIWNIGVTIPTKSLKWIGTKKPELGGRLHHSCHSRKTSIFPGRGIKRNQALWTSFVLESPTLRIFIGGDGGYDKHFAEIGKTFGEFDLAILENGQYDKSWKHIHLMPDEILKAAKDLNAKANFTGT